MHNCEFREDQYIMYYKTSQLIRTKWEERYWTGEVYRCWSFLINPFFNNYEENVFLIGCSHLVGYKTNPFSSELFQ